MRVGDAEIFSIFELDASSVIADVLPNDLRSEVKKHDWLIPNYADNNGDIKAVNQSFLLKIKGQNIIIDTCVGNDRKRPELKEWQDLSTNYLSNLESLGLEPDQVVLVICTHLHFDHI